MQALVSANPLRQLTDDNTCLPNRDRSVKDGQLVYESQTFRTKLNYQFTRAISARVIVEYDTTLANPVETSLARTKEVQTQALLTWLPHPGKVLYLGWNDDLQIITTPCGHARVACVIRRSPFFHAAQATWMTDVRSSSSSRICFACELDAD